MDDAHVKLYDLSCPPLSELLRELKHTRRHGPAVWRRALMLALERMALRQAALARITAAELVNVFSGYAIAVGPYEHSAQVRSLARKFRTLRARRYGRGDLTTAKGYHPDVLVLWLRSAERVLRDPLKRSVISGLAKRLGGGGVPDALWVQLKATTRSADRARAFVAFQAGIEEESLTKTFSRRRRRRQQTR